MNKALIQSLIGDKRLQQIGLGVFALLSVALVWGSERVRPDFLTRQVETIGHTDLLESQWLYLGLLLVSVAFPFVFSFHPRIGFAQNWRYFLLANLPVSAAFISWDMYFAKIGVWGFNKSYVLPDFFLFNLPLEECLFFVLIPFACLFIYAALPGFEHKNKPPVGLTLALTGMFFLIGAYKFEQMYTATTSILAGFSLLYFLFFMGAFPWRKFYVAYLISCIPFVLVNGVLTGAWTNEPVVMYNQEEYFGQRLVSIPVDDFGYSFLMLLWNIGLFELLKSRASTKLQGEPLIP